MLAVQTSPVVPHGLTRSAAAGFCALTFLALVSLATSISASPFLTSSADSLLSLVVSATASALSADFLAVAALS